MTAATASPQPSLVSVYSGRECIGFVLRRANGFEGFTADERSLGTFPTIKAAADTISKLIMDFADHVVGLVRDQLRRHPAFVGMKRDDLDLYLADLERDIRYDLEEWADEVAREAYRDARDDIEADAMLEEMEAEKKKKPGAKQKRAAA